MNIQHTLGYKLLLKIYVKLNTSTVITVATLFTMKPIYQGDCTNLKPLFFFFVVWSVLTKFDFGSWNFLEQLTFKVEVNHLSQYSLYSVNLCKT